MPTPTPDNQPGKGAPGSSQRGYVGPADLELAGLHEKFREPLDVGLALSAAPQAVRNWLAQYLWRAMIAGSSAEEAALDALAKEGLRCDQVELVRKIYRERMRPRISEDELQRIRTLLAARACRNSEPGTAEPT